MTDQTTPETTETSGPNGSSPVPTTPALAFGGLAIDFSADTDAVPLAAAVTPIAFGAEDVEVRHGVRRARARSGRTAAGPRRRS